MKPLAVPVLLTLTIAFAAAAFVQTRQLQTKTLEASRFQAEAQKATAQTEAQVEKISALEEKSKILADESAALREKLSAVSPAPAVPAAEVKPEAKEDDAKEGLGGFLGKMLKDPQMKKAMATQQSMALRQFYSDFVKSSNLSPQQADKLYEMLSARQVEMMEKAGDLMKGDQSAKDAMKASAETTKAFDAELTELLGEGGAKQFHEFEKTLGDRIVMNQFSQQLASTGAPLSADQNNALLQVMTDERSKAPAPAFGANNPANLTLSDEQVQQFFQSQESVNARIRTRAMSLLTADQMKAFEQFQKQQIEMQKMGMTMARQMFGGKKSTP